MRPTKDADSDVGLALAPLQSRDDSDDGPTTGPPQSPGGTSRRPGPVGATCALGSTRQPHRVQLVRPPRAAGPSPGTRAGQALQRVILGSYTPAAGRPSSPGPSGHDTDINSASRNLTDIFYLQSSCGRFIFSVEYSWNHSPISATLSRAQQSQQTGHAIQHSASSRNFSTLPLISFLSPLHPPNIRRAKALAPSA